MSQPQQPTDSVRTRNKAQARKNWSKIEQYLSEVEKVHGCEKSWKLRQRLEQGDVTLAELGRR
jgi:hypothetical protein